MYSAFGVDHGEVSKGRYPRKPRKLTMPQKRTRNPDPNAKSGPEQIKGAFNRIGEAPISLKNIGEGAGKGVRGVGNFLENRPGLTGTALVGGGGAAGYHYLNRKEPKRKRAE